jgi:hypothetical protein
MLSVTKYDQDYIDTCRARMDADAVRVASEPVLYGTLVLALDNMFCHRARGKEPKGGALKKVRELCPEIISGEVTPDADAFARLSEAFFAEIEANFR